MSIARVKFQLNSSKSNDSDEIVMFTCVHIAFQSFYFFVVTFPSRSHPPDYTHSPTFAAFFPLLRAPIRITALTLKKSNTLSTIVFSIK